MKILIFTRKLLGRWLLSQGRLKRFFCMLLVLGCMLLAVSMRVYLTSWHKNFIESLSDRSYPMFLHQIKIFFPLVISSIILRLIQVYWMAHLEFSWRKHMVEHYLGLWLSTKGFYHLSLQDQKLDNPDQRLTQDITTISKQVLHLGFYFMEQSVLLFFFFKMLWSASEVLTIFGLKIPGLLCWLVLGYCSLGTMLGYWVGRSIVPLTVAQERYEATFRRDLVRMETYSLTIAAASGADFEKMHLEKHFGDIENNFYSLLRACVYLESYTYFYQNINSFLPLLLLGPFYFAEAITLAIMMQTSSIFMQVYESLSLMIFHFQQILQCLASVRRLYEFDEACGLIENVSGVDPKEEEDALICQNFILRRPSGKVVLSVPSLMIVRGEKVCIRGPSGIGKTTWLKSIAQLNRSYEGELFLPKGSRRFVMSSDYLPKVSLAQLMHYPNSVDEVSMERLGSVLSDLKLEHLMPFLKQDEFMVTLSQGEIQRLRLAPLLVLPPADWLFMDEPTAHLPESQAQEVLDLVMRHYQNAGVVLISHQNFLMGTFDRLLDF